MELARNADSGDLLKFVIRKTRPIPESDVSAIILAINEALEMRNTYLELLKSECRP
jgi:hypothetical protein